MCVCAFVSLAFIVRLQLFGLVSNFFEVCVYDKERVVCVQSKFSAQSISFVSIMKIAFVGLAAAATVATAIDTTWLDTVRPQEGDEVVPIGSGCSQFDWQETQEVQAAFHEHQYVEDCSSPDARFLVLRTWKVGGLASVMQEVASALHVAHVTKRTLLFQGEGK